MRHCNIPIFVAHMGCPHQCVFCNQRSITHTAGQMTGQRAAQLLAEAIHTLSKEAEVEIAFFGGSFSAIPVQQQEALLMAAWPYVKSGQVKGVRLSTRPDFIDGEILQRFLRWGVTSVELGAQSMDAQVLRLSRRGHTPEDVARASAMILEAGLELGLQMMVGLPGDTLSKSLYTAQEIIRMGAHTTRIYPAVVLRGTPMEQMYREGMFHPLTVEQAVQQCAQLVPLLEGEGVRILRLGLMAEEGLQPERDLVAGPYHPAFGELVRGRIFRNRIQAELDGCPPGARVCLHVHSKDISAITGRGRANLHWLMEQYGLAELALSPDKMERGQLSVSLDMQSAAPPSKG